MKTEKSSHVYRNPRVPPTIPFEMNRKALGAVGIAFAVLMYGTVMVFMAFDRNSHSASDTIRPFIITMGPVWVLAIWSGVSLLRRHR